MKVNFNELKESDILSYSLVKASWLQKAVRRGLVDTAVSIAKVYLEEGQDKGLYRKLLVFCAEDIGMGCPTSILLLDQIKDPLEQVEFLCRVNKNRESDRFLLAVRDNYTELKKNNEIIKEVKTLKILVDVAETWIDNKRLKKNKDKLKLVFDMLADNCKCELKKKVIYVLYEKFLILSKFKSFGSKNLLSLAVILSTREGSISMDSIPESNYNLIELEFVDDFALDKHTSFGKKMNRGKEHWLKEGSPVFPEVKYKELYLNDGSEKYSY